MLFKIPRRYKDALLTITISLYGARRGNLEGIDKDGKGEK